MSDYAVGDIQGCLDPLKRLLERLDFDPARDRLWSVGDILNRGPKSLQTLRFCKSLGNAFNMVLGNHDLHLLATACGARRASKKDSLQEILVADDREDLLNWLRYQPLFRQTGDFTLVHAGIPPIWDISVAGRLAAEVEAVLRSEDATPFFAAMYGDTPSVWSETLRGQERWRVITNYFTRMRFCKADGELELASKGPPEKSPIGFLPWFAHPERKSAQDKIIFGHWATLGGRNLGPNLFPLDTGCVWGGPLRIMRLADQRYFHEPAS